MSDKFQEYLLIGLALLLTIIPILKEIETKKKLSNIVYIITILIVSMFLFSLGVKKVKRDNRNSQNFERKIDTLLKLKKEDSLHFKQFESNLLNNFQIIRDSVTNKPVKVYNTSIQNAEIVNIGSD